VDLFPIDVKDGIVIAVPGRLEEAVRLAGEKRLRGISIREDFAGALEPRCDLKHLRRVPWLTHFSLQMGIDKNRIDNLEEVYGLEDLRDFALHEYTTFDLHRMPRLETLSFTDRPGLQGLDTLTQLRKLQAWGWRRQGFESLSLPSLESVRLIRCGSAVKSLTGVEKLSSLQSLELEHSRSPTTIGLLPLRLRTLKIDACPRLDDLSNLADNESIDFLFVSSARDLEFVPTMRRLTSIGFGDVANGDLSPLLRSSSLKRALFAPKKKYSPSHDDIQRALAARSSG
jgi:internalin A